MPRSFSWQRRLAEIHRQVAESPRDPYSRRDLERLFRVRDRAARYLVEMMPRLAVGSSVVVERTDLLAFLSGCLDAEDLSAHLAALRASPPKPRRRKLRTYLPKDYEPGTIRGLAGYGITVRHGQIGLSFGTLEELASQLLQLSTVLELPEFERRFCQIATAAQAEAPSELEILMSDLQQQELEHDLRTVALKSTSQPAAEPLPAPKREGKGELS